MNRTLVVTMSFFIGCASAFGATYTFTVLAGMSSVGSADGIGGAARFAYPQGVAVDRDGNVFVADTRNHTIRRISATGAVTTFAGAAGERGSADGIGSAARFRDPLGVAVDGAGNVYVAEENHTIRKISPAGVVTTLAGTAGQGGSADGTGSAARFLAPADVAVDSNGNVYVADTGNSILRKITASGVVTTVAGSARQPGNADGIGSIARFSNPRGLAVDRVGNLFVADNGTHTIRKITPAGVVTTLAVNLAPLAIAIDLAGNLYLTNSDINDEQSLVGLIHKVSPDGVVTVLAGKAFHNGSEDGTGDAARFLGPLGLTVDALGNVFVADTRNSTIRKITPGGAVTTLAGIAPGNADGIGDTARFWQPVGLAVDKAGNVYLVDNCAICKITAEGVVTTVAGSAGNPGSTDGQGSAARFNDARDLAIDNAGTLYVADSGNRLIRKITTEGVVTTLAGSPHQTGSVDANGSAARFNFPLSVAVDGASNVHVADASSIRKVTPNGDVTTVAGAAGQFGTADGIGSTARFGGTLDLVVDGAGNLFVSDYNNSTIRKVAPDGTVSTVAGAPGGIGSVIDGPGHLARFYFPRHLALDSAGSVFVVDINNLTIRKITDGVVSTLPATWPSLALETHLALDAAGNLYLSNFGNTTILKGVPVRTADADAQLTNLSVRASLQAQQPLVAGFALRGSKPLLVRGIGSGLQPFISSSALAGDPRLDLYDASGALVASNDNWGGGATLREAFALVGAFPLEASGSDAALVRAINGRNSVHLTAATNGIGLLEAFDLEPRGESQVANLSARHRTGSGPNAGLVAGFTLSGTAERTILIRGVGPALAASPFHFTDVLSDLTLTVMNQRGQYVAANDRWPLILASTFARVGAFPFEAGSKDAALLLTLSPGAYSVVLSGANGVTGEGMIEIYDVP